MGELDFKIGAEAPDFDLNAGVDPVAFAQKMFQATMSPEEIKKIPEDYAIIESTKKDIAEGAIDPRTRVYNRLMSKDDTLAPQKAALLEQMRSDQPMSKSQVAAMMMIGILPMLAGAAIKGKKGIAAGAQAGQIGALTMGKALDDENKNKRATAALEYKDIQDQEKEQKRFQQDVELNELKSMDRKEEKALDRDASLSAASIRASGDAAAGAAIGKELGNVGKALDNDRKATERAARLKPITFGGKTYQSSGAMTDQERKDVTDIMGDYKTADKDLLELYRLSKNMNLGALERVWQDESSEIGQRRKRLINSLQRVQEVPGRGGEYQAKRIEQMVTDPASFYKNFVSQLPGKTGIPNSLKTTRTLLHEQADAFLTSKGADLVIPIGKAKMINGKTMYYIGSDNEGNPIMTESKDRLQQVLDMMR